MQVFFLCVCMNIVHMHGACRGQMRTLSPLRLELHVGELPRQLWELNLGPLRERPGLLTTEPLLQPPHSLYFGGNLDRKEAN